MLTGSDVMSKPLWVSMSDEDWKVHVAALLRHLARVDELEARRAASAKKFKAEIDEEMDEVQRLRRVLTDDGQQMTLAEATVDTDPNVVPQEDATEALAAVAEAAEQLAPAKFHAKGDRCVRENCKRRHLTEEQLRTNGIEPEGPPKCMGCAAELTAIEMAKKHGRCELCHVGLHHDLCEACHIALYHRPPRCSACNQVLSPDDVAQKYDVCESCEEAAKGEA